jgi:hypothetical protein
VRTFLNGRCRQLDNAFYAVGGLQMKLDETPALKKSTHNVLLQVLHALCDVAELVERHRVRRGLRVIQGGARVTLLDLINRTGGVAANEGESDG